MLEIQEPPVSDLKISSFRLLNVVGIALIGFGLFNIILQMKDWRDYFESRIKEILIDQDYLRTLDKETLMNVQTNLNKAYFQNPNIDKKGGFLNYFNDNLHKYISEPYREDVTAELFFLEEDNGNYKFRDKVTYICRKSYDCIQSEIRWKPDKDEFEEIEEVSFSVQFPYNHEKCGITETLEKKPFSGKNSEIDNALVCEENEEEGWIADLSEYKEIDRLIVIVESVYIIKASNFQYWQMVHPTRNFSFTLVYPHECFEPQFKPFVLNDNLCLRTESRGYLNLKYDSWMLPMSGLAWRLKKRGT